MMKKPKISVLKPLGCPGQELSLLSCRCRASAIWHWVSKEASGHHTRQVRRTKDEAETCWQFAMWLRADARTLVPCFPLSAPLIKPWCLFEANLASSVVFDNVLGCYGPAMTWYLLKTSKCFYLLFWLIPLKCISLALSYFRFLTRTIRHVRPTPKANFWRMGARELKEKA